MKFIRLLKDEALTKDGQDLFELEAKQEQKVRSLVIEKLPVRKRVLKAVLCLACIASGLIGVELAKTRKQTAKPRVAWKENHQASRGLVATRLHVRRSFRSSKSTN